MSTVRQFLASADAIQRAPRAVQPERVRYEKEILRTGTWRLGDTTWSVDRAKLDEIATNFRSAWVRGVRVPVKWGHSDDPRDTVGEVTDLRADGDQLVATFWAADPEDVRKIGVTNHAVSVEVTPDWVDGEGRRYSEMLTHLAIVDHPVMPGQGPIKRLELIQPVDDRRTAKGARQMAAKIDGTTLIEYLPKLGIKLPKTTTPDNLMSVLEVLVGLAEEDEPTGGDSSSDAGAVDEEIAGMGEKTMSLVSRLKRERDEAVSGHEDLKRQLSLIQDEREKAAEAAYLRDLDELVRTGRIEPAARDELLREGKGHKYTMALLNPLKRIPEGAAVPSKRRASLGANAKPSDEAEEKAKAIQAARAAWEAA